MDDFLAFEKKSSPDRQAHTIDRFQISEALDAAANRYASSKTSRWDEQLSHLRHALVDLWQADPGVILVAIEHFEWLTARATSKTGLRQRDVIKRARLDFKKVVLEAFHVLMLPRAYDVLFEGHAGAADFIKVMESSIDLWEVKNDTLPERADTLRQTTDLLFEIAWFGHSLLPTRPSTIGGHRTVRTSTGREFCALCFRPSHRYRIQHSLQTSRWALESRERHRFLFTRACPAPSLLQEEISPHQACSKYCEERHSIRVGSDSKLDEKNAAMRCSDGKLSNRVAFDQELKNLTGTLDSLMLAAPRSVRMKRMVAWYRCHPLFAKREIPPRLTLITANRYRAEMVVNHILKPIPRADHGETALQDDVLLIEIWAVGLAKIVRHDGSTTFITKPDSEGAFRHVFAECTDKALSVLDIGGKDLTGFDVAVFEDLGIELQISDNFIRFVFESPTWLRLACGLRTKGAR
ncbi:hypothetical protein [Dyella japonica]|uniref:Uncharacterized protein n=1 Tax=Dyella japonica TaxID=231455 RepID=A0ABV2K0S7_9GAMM